MVSFMPQTLKDTPETPLWAQPM